MYNWSIMGLSDLVIGQSVFDLSVQIFCSDSAQRYFLLSEPEETVLRKLAWRLGVAPSGHQALRSLMGRPHSCFHFQKVDIFQRADKESGCGWKFPLLHHWPKWKQSAHSRPTLWFPLPIPQTCQVWGGHTVHQLFARRLRDPGRSSCYCGVKRCNNVVDM